MQKRSEKKMPAVIPKNISSLYANEILPDLQIRLQTTVREKDYLNVNPTHVGMEKINVKSKAARYFVEFASSCTIHGLNHIVAPHRHPIERFLAVLFIGGALVCLIFLSLIFWHRHQTGATVVGVNINSHTIRIRRPTIIVCPYPYIDVNNIQQVLERHGLEYTEETDNFIRTLANISYETMHGMRIYEKVPPEKWLPILRDLRVNIPDNILKDDDSEQTWMVTENGMCIAIRSLVGIYSSYEYWMSNNWTVLPANRDMSVYSVANHGDVESVTLMDHQIKVTVGDPMDIIPYATLTFIDLRSMERGTLLMYPLDSDERLSELKVHQRGCKFPSDGGLATWPIYTFGMCLVECRMRIIQEKCGCRPFFVRPIGLWKIPQNVIKCFHTLTPMLGWPKDGIPICNTRQLNCIGELTNKLFLYKAPPNNCGCVANCNMVRFQCVDGVTSGLNTGMLLNASVFSMTIEFPISALRRVVFFGFYDFLAAVGGAAGLCLGASVLSFVEIFYFSTLHLCVYANNVRRKYTKRNVPSSRQKI